MDSIYIKGGQKLKGTIKISGAKNAALPLMAASLLTDQPLRLSRCPNLADVRTLKAVLESLGSLCDYQRNVMTLKTPKLHSTIAHYDLVRKMRASILVLGPLLARAGVARVSLPGGCAIGTRPVDLHLSAFEAMGAEIEIRDGYVEAKAPAGGLKGATIVFPKVSVGATENVVMAATLAKGTTRLENAAFEPEVQDLMHLLVSMGARIKGIGTSTIEIQGVEKLGGAVHEIIPDRIEAGSYAIAAAATGGEVLLEGFHQDLLPSFIDVMVQAGVRFEQLDEGLKVKGPQESKKLCPVTIETAPYPGFPTDLQAQFMTLMILAEGRSDVHEHIFENRFMHVPELMRMGAQLEQDGHSVYVTGVKVLKGAPVMATDLRASFSLLIAGLVAQGETTINRIYHLDRGYEAIEDKLRACGAIIERVRDEQKTDNTPETTAATAF